MDHLPIFCQLRQRDCLLVGGGDVAERKARLLLDAGANVTVNALDFTPQFQVWADSQMLTLVQGSLSPRCWITAGWPSPLLMMRRSTSRLARRPKRGVSSVTWWMPRASQLYHAVDNRSLAADGRRLLGRDITGSGAPAARETGVNSAPASRPAARYAGHLRARVKQQFATVGERRRFWEKLFVNDRLAQSLANDDRQAVADTTEQLLTEPLEHRGEVVLVGAGPGDAGLLTLKGLQQIQQADVVVYDRLVSDDIMNLVRRDADRVFVGKRSGYHCVPQEEINQILLREAQKEDAWSG